MTKQKRQKDLHLRLTNKEHQALVKEAKKQDLYLTDLARKFILAGLEKKVGIKHNRSDCL